MKRLYNSMDALLDNAGDRLVADLPREDRVRLTQPLPVIYFPRLGYLTVVQHDPETGVAPYEGEQFDNDGNVIRRWEYQFRTGLASYFKSPEKRELNDCLGDVESMICDE